MAGADSVSPAVLATVSDKERKRQEAIFELVSSERYYVDSLKLVKEVFFDPMAEQEVLTEEEMAKVSPSSLSGATNNPRICPTFKVLSHSPIVLAL